MQMRYASAVTVTVFRVSKSILSYKKGIVCRILRKYKMFPYADELRIETFLYDIFS